MHGGGAGDDVLYFGDSGGMAYGEGGNDVAVGGAGAEVFVMGDGADIVYGNGGQDYFYMGAGNDVMFGGSGVDVMLGEAGDDYMDGGSGIDYYFGGAGFDTFVAGNQPGVKVVQDFIAGEDLVRLEGSGFTSFADIVAHSYQNGAYLVVQVDADTAVWVNGLTLDNMTAANFVLV